MMVMSNDSIDFRPDFNQSQAKDHSHLSSDTVHSLLNKGMVISLDEAMDLTINEEQIDKSQVRLESSMEIS